jgi:hypothetical protein
MPYNVCIADEVNSSNFSSVRSLYRPAPDHSGFVTTLGLTINLKSIPSASFPYIPDETPANVLEQTFQDLEETLTYKILQVLYRKGEGPWIVKAEIRLFNKEPYYEVDLMPYFTRANTIDVAEDLSLGIQLLSGETLAANDKIGVFGTAIDEKKNNGNEELAARIAALEMTLEGFFANLPPNTVLGRNAGAGSITTISQDNFAKPVDITTAMNIPDISGSKYFAKPLFAGIDSTLAIKTYTNGDIKSINAIQLLGSNNGSMLFSGNPPGTFAFSSSDFEINVNTNIPITSQILGGHYRVRNYASSLITNIQGFRLTALNTGLGNVTTLDGAVFTARNDSANTTVATINGGSFNASIGNIAGTATTINGGVFTASSGSTALTTTVRGAYFIASSSNNTPANECIGVEIAAVTGTATKKVAIKTNGGEVILGNLPTSGSGLSAGSLWRDGNILKIV